MGLKEDLKRLKPGDTFPLSGDIRGLGKVIGLKGEPGKPITLDGLGSGRILSSGVPDVGNLRLEKCSHVVVRRLALRDATMDEARAFQAFFCDNLTLEDLRTGPEVRADHLHLVGSRNVTIRRVRCDGAGGTWLRPGVAGHACYVAEDCSDITVEDLEAVRLFGAPLQCNAEDGAIGPVTFRRVRCLDWVNGAGVNLLGPVEVELEDLVLSSVAGNGGVRCTAGAKATVLRFSISVKGKEMLEGPVSVTRGAPQPPRLDAGAPPPDTGGGGEEEDLAAENERLRSLIAEAQAVLARA